MSPANPDDDGRKEYLVGIDDTDNVDSKGTGFHARQIGRLLSDEGVAEPLDITRHQLLFDPRIPYTSHNSSLCLRVLVDGKRVDDLVRACRAYLLENSAPGSDAGLCVVARHEIGSEVEDFGRRAKEEILTLDMARSLAARASILLEGLTGDHGGMIGSLAGVGLRRGGRDGRIVWRPGIREATGIMTAGDLVTKTGIDVIRRIDGKGEIAMADRIDVRPWPRAVMIEDQAVLFVQKAGSIHDHFDWQLASKSVFHSY